MIKKTKNKLTRSYQKVANFSDLEEKDHEQISLKKALSKCLPHQQVTADIENKLINDWMKKSNEFMIDLISFAKRKNKKKPLYINKFLNNIINFAQQFIFSNKNKHINCLWPLRNWRHKLLVASLAALIISLSVVLFAPNLSQRLTSFADNLFLSPIVFAFDIEPMQKPAFEINKQVFSNYILKNRDEINKKYKQGQTSIMIKESDLGGRVAGAFEESPDNQEPQFIENFDIVLAHASKEITTFIGSTYKKQKTISIKLNDKLIKLINSFNK